MQYFDGEDLPFYAGLARTFPLAVRWFCSCPGPTLPNRRYLSSATSHGLIDDVSLSLDDYPAAGTIFDLLSANGISWANYIDEPSARVILPTLLGRRAHGFFRRVQLALAGLLPGLEQLLAGGLFFTAAFYPRSLLASWHHVLPVGRFFQQARRGQLPAVSFVDPDYVTYSEENPQGCPGR
jgi:phospholipase C